MRGEHRHQRRVVLGCALAAAVVVGGASAIGGQPSKSAPATARAELKDAKGQTVGRAELTETPNGVLVQLTLTDAPSGVHAFHVHETGRCDAPAFKSAGSHFNPTGARHGFEDADGPHAGDFPNLHISEAGTLEVELLADNAALSKGKQSLLDSDGSALVLHAGPDDYHTDPAGDSGDRVACGVVQD